MDWGTHIAPACLVQSAASLPRIEACAMKASISSVVEIN